MMMPGRKYSIANTNYRYGFNGKENDKDIENGAQDYGMRIYDGRLGRFLSVDPLAKRYPWLTPYQFSENNPIRFTDLDGAEIFDPFTRWYATDAAITITTKPTSAKAKVYGAIMGVSGSVQGVVQGAIHPVQSAKGLLRMAANTPVENAVDYGMNMAQNYGDLPEPVQNYAVYGHFASDMALIFTPFKGIFKTGSLAKVDLMGGSASKFGKGWINFDKAATAGIADDVANFSKHFAKSSVKEIIANNPRASFLSNVTEALQEGGTITVRGQMANRYFKEIWNGTAQGIEGYEVLPGSKKTGLSTEGYYQEGNKPLKGDANSLNEIILRKKK